MSKTQFDKTIFKSVKFSDILEDIYNNSKKKANDIDDMIVELRELIKTPQDAMLIVPLLSDYLGRGIDNDSQLIKMSQIIQRALTKDTTTEKNSSQPETFFSDEDLKLLEDLARSSAGIQVPNTVPLYIDAPKVKSKPESPEQ